MKLRYKIGLVVTVLGAVFLLGRCSRRGVSPTMRGPKNAPSVLPSNDTEQIRVDPGTHKLVIVTKRGTQTLTLPDRQSTIDVLKSGQVKITAPQTGFEHHLFVAGVIADYARIGGGMDLWYFKRLDVGIGMADRLGPYLPALFAKATYNVKGNLQLGLVYQSNKYIGGVIAVRIF